MLDRVHLAAKLTSWLYDNHIDPLDMVLTISEQQPPEENLNKF